MPDTPEKKKRRKREQSNNAYNPVICEDCNEEIYQTVSLEITAPLGWLNLSKMGLRSSRVSIIGASYDLAHWTCKCGVRPPADPPDARLGPAHRQTEPIVDRAVADESRPPKVIRDPIDAP